MSEAANMIPFSSVVELNPPTPLHWNSVHVPFISMDDVSEDAVLKRVSSCPRRDLSSGLRTFQDGDVLIAKITPCLENGKGAFVQGLGGQVGVGSTEFHVLRPRPGIYPRYVYHWSRYPAFRHAAAASMTGSAGQRRVPASFFRQYWIPIHNYLEQQRIAEILDSTDEAIRLHEEYRSKLQEIGTGVTQRLFDADIVHPGLDAKGADWPVAPLAELAEIRTGVTLGNEPSGPSSIELPYLRVANVQDGRIDTSEVKTIRILLTQVDRYCLQRGDLLLTEGGDFDKLGRGAVWDGRIPLCLHQNHIFCVRPDGRRISGAFLAMYAASPAGRRYFLSISKQTTNLASINSTQLGRMPIPVPSRSEQDWLMRPTFAVRQRVEVEAAELIKLRSIKQGLMQNLFSGKVRIPG
jgi:type I restriction enzyme, S subunit